MAIKAMVTTVTATSTIDCSSNNISNKSDYVIHGLIQCNVPINLYKVALRLHPKGSKSRDVNGNLPLHRLVEGRPFRLKEREAIQETLKVYPRAVLQTNDMGETPLWVALTNKIPWNKGVQDLVEAAPHGVSIRHMGWLPFQWAALQGGKYALDNIYHLLLTRPDLLLNA
jgi:hypothetical protein